jgi:YggT family protein
MVQLAIAVQVVANVFTWVVFASVVLSYFLDPYNPIRQALDRIVEPFLAPIRRLIPSSAGMLDFSPMILIFLVWIVSRLIISILTSL